MTQRHHHAQSHGAVLHGLHAWRQQPNRPAVLLAHQLGQATMRGATPYHCGGPAVDERSMRLQCPRCNVMGGRLLQRQGELVESRVQVLDLYELARQIDTALQAVLPCRRTSTSCAAELSALRHRLVAETREALAPAPVQGIKGTR